MFEQVREKFGSTDKELQYFLPKKLSLSSQKYGLGIRDPRSGIRNPRSGKKNLSQTPGSKKHRNADIDDATVPGNPLSSVTVI
jgi:hypothetical protein